MEKSGVTAHWLMTATSDADKESALAECAPGEYKVVFASNLAETSLTIAGIRYVVDSGLICQPEWDPQLAASSAPIVTHSRSGVRQRWGRVGRKTYGWVFPLYTAQQFAQMPRDTPAGSTQTSLEQFYMKLAAAGVDDIDTVKLPANFPSSTRDKAGADVAESFGLESERAKRALIANGAMTLDRQLTPLGRELERSRLSAERTMALLFADRLACVPEVAVALVALDAGALVGPDRLLRSSWRWPGAWCVQARRCHEALAFGCEDDLDLVLRIYSEWETASDRSAWARQWWVDSEALLTIKEQADKLIDDIAPGMSKAAGRPLDLRLTSRARAVLSRALTSAHYARKADDTWCPADPRNGKDVVRLPQYHLTRPSDHVLALKRDRPRPQRGEPVNPMPVLYGLINVLPWACADTDEVEGPDPFTLMIKARRLRSPSGELVAPDDVSRPLRAAFPVGAFVLGRLAGDHLTGMRLVAARVVKAAFTLPDELPERADSQQRDEIRTPRTAKRVYSGNSGSGQESRGDIRARAPIVAGTDDAPEELVDRPRNILELEPEELGAVRIAARVKTPAQLLIDDDRLAAEIYAADVNGGSELPIGEEFLAQVVAYSQQSSSPCLHLQRIGTAVATRTDPAVHDDLKLGASVDVVAGKLISAPSGVYRVLGRCDEAGRPNGLGDLFFHGRGIDEYDTTAATSVMEGSQWKARILAWTRPHEIQSVSLIGEMYSRLVDACDLADGNTGNVKRSALVLGAVTAGPVVVEDDRCLVVTLDIPDTNGFRPRILVPINNDAVEAPATGTPVGLLVAPKLKARRSGRWKPEQLEQITANYSTLVKPDGDHIELISNGALSDEGVEALLRLSADSAIKEQVWGLWATSRHYGAAWNSRLQPVIFEEVSGTAATLLANPAYSRALAQRHNVEISYDSKTAKLTLIGGGAEMRAARSEVQALNLLFSATIEIPSDRMGNVIGREHSGIDAIRKLPGVASADIRGTTIIVAADRASSLELAAEQVLRAGSGTYGTFLANEPQFNGRLIKRSGQPLEEWLKQQSGCTRIEKPGSDGRFKLEGPDRVALHKFGQVAASLRLPGEVTITAEHSARVLERSKPAESYPSGGSRSTRPPGSWAPRLSPGPPPPLVGSLSGEVRRPDGFWAPRPSEQTSRPVAPPKPRTATADGTTVEEALAAACAQLSVNRENVTWEVLDEGKRGRFFGKTVRRAVVRVTTT